jgi:hypothetical protein
LPSDWEAQLAAVPDKERAGAIALIRRLEHAADQVDAFMLCRDFGAVCTFLIERHDTIEALKAEVAAWKRRRFEKVTTLIREAVNGQIVGAIEETL